MLSQKERDRLKADIDKGMSNAALAEKYGVVSSTVSYYRSGHSERKEGKATRWLTPEQRKTAAEDAKGGMSRADLAQKYGFTEDTARYYIDRYLYDKKNKRGGRGKKDKRRTYTLPKELRDSVLEAAKTMSPAELVLTYNISDRNAQDYVRKVRGTPKVTPSTSAEPQVVVQQYKPALSALPAHKPDRISVTSDGSTVYIAIPSAMLKSNPAILSTLLCLA